MKSPGEPDNNDSKGCGGVMHVAPVGLFRVAHAACLQSETAHEETLRAIELAEELATLALPHDEAIALQGQGWIAGEALAISIYCALVARNFRHGVGLAVNHDGDSDSTGSIVNNLLGVIHGVKSIPAEWLEPRNCAT